MRATQALPSQREVPSGDSSDFHEEPSQYQQPSAVIGGVELIRARNPKASDGRPIPLTAH